MRNEKLRYEERNRYAHQEANGDLVPPSKALQDAIEESRKQIEAAFLGALAEKKLGRLKVKVKAAQ